MKIGPLLPPYSIPRATVGRSILVAVLFALLLTSGCRRKPPLAAIPIPDAEAAQALTDGDAAFRMAHLYGWRQAESLYRKAHDTFPAEETRRKLLLTRFLILVRQVDEDIPHPESDRVVGEICSAGDSWNALCEIARWYVENKKGRPPAIQDFSLFGKASPQLEDYFRLLLSDADARNDPDLKSAALAAQSGTSPLFLYLNPEKVRRRDPAEIELDYPGFAEALEWLAESHFQMKKYRSASASFRKALELIPDYTRAINGLGNISFFALEDYERALTYYESALNRDPANTAAMFGKGAALHKLGRYPESTDALDRMLAGDLLRGGRLSAEGFRYYSGEGLYLKAYNHYLSGDPAKARELVDAARRFLPDSEEVLDLSGVLFYRAGLLNKAREDFLSVIEKGRSNCNAQMHLGLIYHRMDQTGAVHPSDDPSEKNNRGYLETWSIRAESAGKKSLNYLLGACACMESAVRNLRNQIDLVSTMDLDARDKLLLKGRLESRLMDTRISYSSNIDTMIHAASENMIAGKDSYLTPMREIGARMRVP